MFDHGVGALQAAGIDHQPLVAAPHQQRHLLLGAGQGSHIDAQGKVAAPYAVDANAVTAWRRGKLVFDNAPLSEVVVEVSRYRAQPLHVAPGKAAALRLSSTFSTDDPDALLRALPSILPVQVKTRPDGSSEIILK